MGMQYNWICTNAKCNTEVISVSGGLDRGFVTKTQTRICKSCKNVDDYEVGVVSDSTHRIFTEAELKSNENLKPKCKNCESETLAWDKNCPDCGSPMEHDSLVVLWD
jgi:RNA polymerase subunit RPABC4/transcription elongation factor Spt4